MMSEQEFTELNKVVIQIQITVDEALLDTIYDSYEYKMDSLLSYHLQMLRFLILEFYLLKKPIIRITKLKAKRKTKRKKHS